MSGVDVQGLIDSLEIKRVDVTSLIPFARNSRTHSASQVQMLASQMREVGWTSPILIDGENGIIAGHGRLEAARLLKLQRVPVIELSHLSEAQKRALVIWDNRSSELAGWDLDMLKLELDDLALGGFDLGTIGFDEKALAEMFPDIDIDDNGKDPDEVPEVPEVPHSKTGDVWVCGPHRIMCGDSLAISSWEKLMGTEKADVCITDPPYGVKYESKLAGAIQNDDLKGNEFLAFLRDAFACLYVSMKPGASIYVYHADTEGYNFRAAFAEAGFHLSGCLIWKKNALVLGRSPYQWIHEPALFGWKPGGSHRFFGGRKQTTVTEFGDPFRQQADGSWVVEVNGQTLVVNGDAKIEGIEPSIMYCDKPKRSAEHPTMKPVELIVRNLKNSARPNDIVIDAFGGSGTTMIAAEMMGMCARLCELDAKFVDVQAQRYFEYTGRVPVHAETGELFPVKRDTSVA